MRTQATYYVLGIPVFKYVKETDEPPTPQRQHDEPPAQQHHDEPQAQQHHDEPQAPVVCPLCNAHECVCKESGDGNFVL